LNSETTDTAEDSFLRLGREVHQFLASAAPLPMSMRARLKFHDDGYGWESSTSIAPDATLLRAKIEDALSETAISRECVSLHLSAGLFSDLSRSRFRTPFTALLDTVLLHFNTNGVADADERSLRALYRRHRAQWMEPASARDISLPLFNTASVPAETELVSGFRISPFTSSDKEAFVLREIDPFGHNLLSIQELLSSHCQLKTTVVVPHHEVDIAISRILSACRLHKSGDIGALARLSLPRNRLFHGSAVSNTEFQTPVLFSRKYDFLPEDYEPIRRVFLALEAQQDRRDLTVAIKRFNQSYTRESAEDKLIDLTIALESCLLSGLRDELKYRLSLRGAALLARLRPPRDTQRILSTMYDARSSVVHEGNTVDHLVTKSSLKSKLGLGVQELILLWQQMVRDVIKTYLFAAASGKTVAEINAALDARLLGGVAE
jgi:hypothetical protein